MDRKYVVAVLGVVIVASLYLLTPVVDVLGVQSDVHQNGGETARNERGGFYAVVVAESTSEATYNYSELPSDAQVEFEKAVDRDFVPYEGERPALYGYAEETVRYDGTIYRIKVAVS